MAKDLLRLGAVVAVLWVMIGIGYTWGREEGEIHGRRMGDCSSEHIWATSPALQDFGGHVCEGLSEGDIEQLRREFQ